MMNDNENLSKEIQVFLLGPPRVLLGNEEVVFPFKQAEAIFYYLILEKDVCKNKISDLIWGDKCDDEKLKPNIRNAVYVIRKIFGKDFLVEPRKNVININSNYKICLDIETIFNNTRFWEAEAFSCEILEDFYLKDNDLYNNWVVILRQHYKDLFMERVTKTISSCFELKEYETCEALCYSLMQMNEFDDMSYKYLIDIYKIRQNYNKAISIYQKLEKLLEEELFEAPDKEIVKMINEVKTERNQRVSEFINSKNKHSTDTEKNKGALIRKEEVGIITDTLNSFLSNKWCQSIMVIGEEGIGKTYLANMAVHHISTDYSVKSIITKCYQAESTYMLKAWQTILEKLIDIVKESGDENYAGLLNSTILMYPFLKDDNIINLSIDEIASMKFENIEKKIAAILIRIAKTNKLILTFDDIQWADEATISLIRTVITEDKNKNILFIFTYREEAAAESFVEHFICEMRINRFFKTIVLERLSYEQTIEVAQEVLPAYDLTDDFKRQLYDETEGNPFFIIEMLHHIECNGTLGDITPNIRDVIRNRILYIAPENKKMLELLSMFFDKASFDVLLELSNKKEYELLEILEYLINNKLIEETYTNNVYYSFTHKKIMDYVYNEMSYTKRILLHNKIGNYFEQKLESKNSDVLIYTKLIHHFEKAKNNHKYIKYIIKYIHCYLNTAHEYFHLIESNSDQICDFNAKLGVTDIYGIEKMLNHISDMVNENFDFITDKESIELISDYYHMIGRYYIRKVEYKSGLEYIDKLKNLNLPRETSLGSSNIIKANRQLLCVYINRYETHRMRGIIEESFKILEPTDKEEEKAIWFRLSGLYEIMTSNVEKGFRDLYTAIEIFEKSKFRERYLFNLAASYAWIGEGKRHQMKYEESMHYYDKAIQICNTHNLVGGVSTFYAYAGMSAYDNHQLLQAKNYLEQSIYYYEKTDLLWGRALAYSYYALIMYSKTDYTKTMYYLKKAEGDAGRLDSNYERGVINRIYYQIVSQMKSDRGIRLAFSKMLPEGRDFYRDKAIRLLKDVFSPIDSEYLK